MTKVNNTQVEIVVALNDAKIPVNQFGDTVDLAAHKIRHLRNNGGCYRMIATKTGGTQLRHAEMSVFDALVKNAIPLDTTDNRSDEVHEDIEKYLTDSISLVPKILF